MKVFLRILVSVVVILIVSGLFFVLSLFLDGLTGIGVWFLLVLLALLVIVFGIIGLIKPKVFPIKTRASHIMVILSAILISVSTFFIAAINMAVYQLEDYLYDSQALTTEQKLEYYIETAKIMTNSKSNQQLEQMENQTIDQITFYYTKDMDYQPLIDVGMEAIDQARTTYQNLFGKIDHESSFKVVFYHDFAQLSMNNDKKMDGALFGGEYHPHDQSIHIPTISNDVTLEEFRTTMIHEYTHHLLHLSMNELSNGNLPVWLDEGVASYIGSLTQGIRDIDKDLEFVSFDDIETPGQWKNHLREPYDPYFQSRLFISYLIAHEGQNVIQKLLDVPTTTSFDEAFKTVTGQSISDYGEVFIKEVNRIPELMNQADILDREKDWQGALTTFNQVLAIAPNHILANHRIANIYMEMGDYENAWEYREAVLGLDPESDSSYTYYAETMLFNGEIKKAIDSIEKAIGISKRDPKGADIGWLEGYLTHLIDLEENISDGTPLKGYLSMVNSDYVFLDQNKLNLIDVALKSYPDVESEDKYNLLEIKRKLEQVME